MKQFLSAMLALGAAVSFAQWSDSPSSPLALADRSGPQVQPKIAPTPDGGSYVGWFDSSSGGYDVYLQRLDRNGNELWPHQGVLVADRGVSSTQDWDLEVDSFGNALVTFNDDRAGNAICVNRVNGAGMRIWGVNGVQLSPTGFLGFPKVAQLSDGTFAVGFSVDNSFTWSRLDVNGNILGTWSASETGKPYTLSDLIPSDNGSLIILYVRRFSTSGSSAKALWAQKYSPSGTALWNGGNAVPIYAPTGSPYGTQGGSIQNGTFPTLVSDGSGGAVCGWYETGGPRNALVQRVRSNGSLVLPAHGMAVDVMGATLIKVGCSAAFDPETDSIYAAAVETNSTQSQYRIMAQRISAEGVREWTDAGVTIIPTNGNQPSFVQAGVGVNHMLIFGQDARSATTGVVFSAGVTKAGVPRWGTASPFLVSDRSTTGKGRLTSAASYDRCSILAWQDGDFGTADIHANRVNEEGYLGAYIEAYPSSLTVIEGYEFSGGIGELVLSDDFSASFFNDENTLGCTVDMTMTINPIPSSVLVLEVEGSVQRAGLAQSIRMKNVSPTNFEVVAGQVARTRDYVNRIELPSIPRYITANGGAELHVVWTPINDEDPSQDGWLHSLDQVRIMGR